MFLLLPMALSGQYSGIRHETALPEAHEYAVNSFVRSKGFGYSRMRRKSLWNERSLTYEGQEYQIYGIELIGLTPEHGHRYFEGHAPPAKLQVKVADHRKLTADEQTGISSLLKGKSGFVEIPSDKTDKGFKYTSVVALIRAREECLRCHDSVEGDALGAFAYTLYRVDDGGE